MPGIKVIIEGDNAWPDLMERLSDVWHAFDIEIAYLVGGMESGADSIAIRIDLPDDRRVVIVETSWTLLATAVRALAARHGWPE